MASELSTPSQSVQQYIKQPIQTYQLQNGKYQGNKGLLIALLILVIFLFLIIIFLNYFNLLPLGSILPKQTIQKETPSSTPSPSEVIIDKKRATDILSSLITSSIHSEYQPNTFSLKHGLSDLDRVSEGSFHGDWKYENATGAALITLSKTRTNIDNIRIGFITPAISPEITEQTVKKHYSQYFSIIPQGRWECQPSNNGVPGIYCENFWEKNKTKIFSYIRNPSANSAVTASLVMCQIFPTSLLYSWDSCNPEFANKENVTSQ